jgi:dihydroneopterin aldolase
MGGKKLDKIVLKGMKFYSHSGLYPFEREVGQPIEVDVICSLNLKKAGESDKFGDTLDYSEIYEKVAKVMERGTHSLIEALASDIATSILAFEPVSKVEVHCRKPKVRLSGILDYVEVAIERSK